MNKWTGIIQALVEDPKSLLIVLGAVIFVGALAGGVPAHLPIPEGPPRIAIAVFGAALAVVGVYLVLVGKSGAWRPYGIAITTPANDSSEPATFIVQGVVKRLPADKELWLV